MSVVTSFSPVADKSARILILGSMPGVLSLRLNQYYAHPRNAFWHIMADIFDVSADLPYETRLKMLHRSGIALWDVLRICARQGSLDSAIEAGSRVPNDFHSFFKHYTNIRLIAFNGAEAEKSFNAYVLPKPKNKDIRYVRLPSTSPAHAITIEKKIAAWRKALDI